MHLTGSQLENDIVIYMLPGLPVKLISPAGRYGMFRRRGIFSISRGLANVWFGIHSFQTVPLRLEASRTPCNTLRRQRTNRIMWVRHRWMRHNDYKREIKIFLGALMIRSLRVFEISLTTCKICGNNSAEKLISEPVLKVLHYNGIYGVFWGGTGKYRWIIWW